MKLLNLHKKAEMGVGTLIIFIAMLLVAAVAAGVLIQTSGALQEKALSTGQESKNQIATSAFTVEISGTDGRTRNLTDFSQIMKLNPGSEPISLDSVMLSIATQDYSATLKYRGIVESFEQNNQDGYNTWMPQEFDDFEIYNNDVTATISVGPGAGNTFNSGIDFDDDGITDSFRTCDGSGNFCPIAYDGAYLQFIMSSGEMVYAHMLNNDGSIVDISSSGEVFDFSHVNIGDYGYISGLCTAGTFTTDWIDSGDFNPGDYFRIYENPALLEEDIDDDNLDDSLTFTGTNALIMLGSNETITIPLGVDISNPSVNINIVHQPIVNADGDTLGYLDIVSPNAGNRLIPAGDTVMVTPYKIAQGYFSVVYETQGSTHRDGKFIRGDVIRLYYQSPGPVGSDEYIKVTFIPKVGTPTVASFVTPDVISEQRMYLYP